MLQDFSTTEIITKRRRHNKLETLEKLVYSTDILEYIILSEPSRNHIVIIWNQPGDIRTKGYSIFRHYSREIYWYELKVSRNCKTVSVLSISEESKFPLTMWPYSRVSFLENERTKKERYPRGVMFARQTGYSIKMPETRINKRPKIVRATTCVGGVSVLRARTPCISKSFCHTWR